MARKRTRTTRTRGKTKSSQVRMNFANAGLEFQADQNYHVKIGKDYEIKEGAAGPYVDFKIYGVGDYSNSFFYHMVSSSEKVLSRARTFAESFGFFPGEMDMSIEEFAEEMVGREAMCTTYLDTYGDSQRIRSNTFWSLDEEGVEAEDDEDEEEKETEDFDLDELEEEEVKALAEACGIRVTSKSRHQTLLKKLKGMDEDEVAEAYAGLQDEEDEEEAEEGVVSASEVSKMNEDELEDLIETHDLDVDLGDFKTLKRKRAAVMDALEEEELLQDD